MIRMETTKVNKHIFEKKIRNIKGHGVCVKQMWEELHKLYNTDEDQEEDRKEFRECKIQGRRNERDVEEERVKRQ